MTTANQSIAVAQQSTIARLIDREERLIAESQRMRDEAVAVSGRWAPTWTWSDIITKARKRLSALRAGLMPVRLSGKFYSLDSLVQETQHVPSEIMQQAKVAEAKFPGSQAVVYGWEKDMVTEERRRRDPVLVLRHADAQYFLGFWLEIETPDTAIPEFFGITAPWAEPRGRGRPRKGELAAPRHALVQEGR